MLATFTGDAADADGESSFDDVLCGHLVGYHCTVGSLTTDLQWRRSKTNMGRTSLDFLRSRTFRELGVAHQTHQTDTRLYENCTYFFSSATLGLKGWVSLPQISFEKGGHLLGGEKKMFSIHQNGTVIPNRQVAGPRPGPGGHAQRHEAVESASPTRRLLCCASLRGLASNCWGL